MFKNVKALSNENHQDLKFTPGQNFLFAEDMVTSPLTYKEIVDASKSYPVVFPEKNEKDIAAGFGPLPVSLFSLLKGKNIFINGEGTWDARYIPAHIRYYPFALVRTGDDNERFAVVIDESAPHFGTKGEALFTKSGNPAKLVKDITSRLTEFQKDIFHTQKLTLLLEQHDLLKMQQISYGKEDDKKPLRSFRVVDEQKLHTLDDNILAAWVRNGLVALLMGHLFSLRNIGLVAEQHGVEALGSVGTN